MHDFSKNIRVILNIVTLVVTLAINTLANSLPINGRMTGEISDSFPVLFTPAGYVFAIWGLIYLLLAGFAIYQALPAGRNNPRLDRVGYWFIASNLFNGAWIFFWHYGLFALTEIAMLGLLVSLIMVYLRLRIGLENVPLVERLLVNLPFSVYLGWITVATVANTSIFLYDLGWNGGALGPVFWTVLMIVIATVLGVGMIFLRREVAYPLVLVWAFAGIAVKQGDTPWVAITAAAAAAGLLVLTLVTAGYRFAARKNWAGAHSQKFARPADH
jgi:hypothetical protein